MLLTAIDKYAYVMRIHGDAGELSVLCFDLGSAMQVREMTLPVFDYYCASGLQKAPYSHEEAMFLTAMYRAPSPIAVCGEDLFAHDLSDNSIWRLCLTSGELTEIPVVLPKEAASFNLTYEERGFLKPSPLALSPDGKLLFTAATDPESGNRAALLVSPADGAVTLLPGTPHDLSSVAFAGGASGSADSVLFAGLHELYACSAEGMPLSEISWSGDNPVSFTAYAGKIFCVFPDERLRIYQGTTEILSVPLTFNLQNAMVSGRDFRYVFTEDRLYLYCGADLNVISLDGNANTPVFSAACVLDNLNDRKSLLQFSMEPQKQLPSGSADSAESGLFHLAAVSEYSPAELPARALAQLDAFEPEQSG